MPKVLLLTLYIPYLLCASEGFSIDAQISQIQNAPARERVKLMNTFKQKLAKMNSEDRLQAIGVMRSKMQSHSRDDSEKHQMQNKVTQMQMEHSESMQGYQNINPSQTANKMLHENMGNSYPQINP